jgi:ABC-type nitrate/sulfonate/bicarbonate transport system permease component
MLILFGLGSASKVALGFSEALFPVILATAAGTSQVEPRLVWSAAALGTTRRAALHKVVLPAALPAILTGARIGLVGAIIGVFLGEMIAGANGLGHLMAVAYRTLDTPAMYVAIITVSLVGFVLDRAFLAARGRLLAWS